MRTSCSTGCGPWDTWIDRAPRVILGSGWPKIEWTMIQRTGLLFLTLGMLGWSVPALLFADEPRGTERTVRIAVFNVWELSREKLDQVDEHGRGTHPQLRAAAEVIQRVRPDVMLLNEIDFDAEAGNVQRFIDRYLAKSQADQEPIVYPHVVFEPVNTGVPSGLDFSNDGDTDDPEDAWGFGRYPGQYGMALLSQFPVDHDAIRTFRRLRWITMPGGLIPDGRDGRPAWYGQSTAVAFRLSSKSHWDVPVNLGNATLHLLASHPTPPVFDGDEDRNGRRNFDEIRLWKDYLSGGSAATYVVDDVGNQGGLDPDASFVILGDLNAAPGAASPYGTPAVAQLLDHPRIRDPRPQAAGFPASEARKTSKYGRIDYVLPSHDLAVRDAGVFRPAADSPLGRLIEGETRASDHWLVWVDIEMPRAR